MQPEIDLGPVTIQTFGLCLALALVSCGLIVGKRLRELGRPSDWSYEMVFAAGLGGVVGAKVDWIIQNAHVAFDRGVLETIFGPGLVFFGGLLGGAIAVCLWAWRRNFLGWNLTDLAAPAIALGYALGRIGCQLSGDGDYGVSSDLPWAMSYPEGTVPTDQQVHPAPIYELLAMGLVAVVLWRLRGRFAPGVLFGLYLVLAGTERLLVETIRRNEAVLASLTLPQLISIATLLAGSALIAWRVRVAARPAPA
jgi:phosphatidylglycerol:prolipoprotein diacylglycerol transferase